jgi:hypothetical protein
MIIIGVMGGLFFLGIIIAVIIIIRKFSYRRREIIPVETVVAQRPRSNKMTPE